MSKLKNTTTQFEVFMPIIQLPESIQKAIGKLATNDLVKVLNQVEKNQLNTTILKVEDKFEKQVIKSKIELKDEISNFRTETTNELTKTNKEILKSKIELKDEMSKQFKWVVGMWMTQSLALSGIFFTLLSK